MSVKEVYFVVIDLSHKMDQRNIRPSPWRPASFGGIINGATPSFETIQGMADFSPPVILTQFLNQMPDERTDKWDVSSKAT